MGLRAAFSALVGKKTPAPVHRRSNRRYTPKERMEFDQAKIVRDYFQQNPAAAERHALKVLGLEDESDPLVKATRRAEIAIKNAEAAGQIAAAKYIEDDPDIGREIALGMAGSRRRASTDPMEQMRQTLEFVDELRDRAGGSGESSAMDRVMKYVGPMMPGLLIGMLARTNPQAAQEMAQAIANGQTDGAGPEFRQTKPTPVARVTQQPVPQFQQPPPVPDVVSMPPAGLQVVPVPAYPPASGSTITPERVAALVAMAPDAAAEAFWNMLCDLQDEGGGQAQLADKALDLLIGLVPDNIVHTMMKPIAEADPAWAPLVAHYDTAPEWFRLWRERLRQIDAEVEAEKAAAQQGAVVNVPAHEVA